MPIATARLSNSFTPCTIIQTCPIVSGSKLPHKHPVVAWYAREKCTDAAWRCQLYISTKQERVRIWRRNSAKMHATDGGGQQRITKEDGRKRTGKVEADSSKALYLSRFTFHPDVLWFAADFMNYTKQQLWQRFQKYYTDFPASAWRSI